MDDNRFDRWTRTRATSANRRSLLGWSLIAGVAAAASRLQPAAAQFGNGGACNYSVTLVSSLTAGATATGTITFEVGQDGAIDTGSLTLTGQAAASVTGQATGSSIDLLVSLADGTLLSLTGVASAPISACGGPIVGFLANPGTGQLGTWEATASGAGQTPSNGGGSGQTSGAPAAQTPPQNQGQGNPPPPGQDQSGTCLALHSQCNASAECCSGWCTDNECRSCGDTICGEDCIVLSDNLAHCGQCFNACNTDTQSCVDGVCTGDGDGGGEDGGGGCTDLGGGCGFSAQCCSGWCNVGTCDSCGMVVCNDMCVDTSSDDNNCGNCNNMCIGTTCQNGSCQ